MTTSNHTGVSHTVFHLLGIPGLEEKHMWVSIPFFISYIMALLGNSLLIFIILTRSSLHEPMYLFLCMLAGTDVVLSTCTVPQALAIFWFHAGKISLDRCITQVFFVISTFMSESGILLAMVFDCYITMLPTEIHHYSYTHADWKNWCDHLTEKFWYSIPHDISSEKTDFCKSNILPHTLCEHIELAKYSCNDIRVNIWYGIFVLISTISLDAFLIIASYILLLVLSSTSLPKMLATKLSTHVVPMSVSSFSFMSLRSLRPSLSGLDATSHHILLANVCIVAPPMLNPIIYGIKTKQIREQVTHVLFPKEI